MGGETDDSLEYSLFGGGVGWGRYGEGSVGSSEAGMKSEGVAAKDRDDYIAVG